MRATTVLNTTTTVLSFALLATAFAPAQADTIKFRYNVERSISSTLEMPRTNAKDGVATVSVRIDANGSVQDATLVQSTGITAFDNEAVRTAQSVTYPAGSARNVVMVLGFGRLVTTADRAKGVATAMKYRTDTRQLLASKTTGQPTS